MTISVKTVQETLNVLGANPILVADGIIGPKTTAAIKSFQARAGLKQDGILGRATLDALGFDGLELADGGGTNTSLAGPNTVSSSDAEAYAIAARAGKAAGLTEQQIQYALTVARGEGNYGRGWANPSAKTIERSKKFGLTGYEGANSNNWGAIQGKGNAGSFKHVDAHADGTDYVSDYRAYKTPEDGFLDVAKILFGGGTRKAVGATALKDAIARGNLRDAVFAQHANGYFEASPETYLKAVLTNYGKLSNAIGWPKVLSENGITPGRAAGGAGFLS